MNFLLKPRRQRFFGRYFVTTPTSMVKRLTGEETWTDNITFATGKGIGNAGASTNTMTAATAAAWTLTDGTTVMASFDTRKTATGQGAITLLGQPMTIASAAGAITAPTLAISAKTVTISGTTQTASLFGIGLTVAAQTVTDASVCTLDAASAVHIVALAAAGGSLTITASYMISTSVSDCFLTNAGVWTDHSSGRAGKEGIEEAQPSLIVSILEKVMPRTWRYREEVHGDDGNLQRVGIVGDELPEELQVPGPYPKDGIASGVVGSFALAALKYLYEKNKSLEARLAALEG